ncbi:MAG TPA: hypothetical protein DCQ26_02355 [Marinilabiliales bacterium]|nr:MAG: hypothetical protein A2W84_10250 [Bacteroidetes bacterium GWC2_40_13]OFX71968.1 MAG: hypothetical protein A2W96_03335 [Bacteroidetes bacterium GWD2_40_43]OFX89479.1 MAG: hypothetical protein A2W97_14085 [Bacteroidetes bacterium GWE2_40_63]OFY23304.1 MAG: hypothetical protein A2W88_19745 [Bacteroidetes bacterium GWF2_40_13]OFZ28085.1 MAG: hypothetical protein A2437_04245 [Bacteroidetes bacterium RIFOXYC2_FULL_40_12]HAM97429.1 hypothetical protein [Marinilabiliales bacterium]
MIQVAIIITISLSLVLGFYTIILLHNSRNKYTLGYLNSFFYYQVLLFLFGFYGILGSLLIRQILPKFDISFTGIETISQLLPFIGLPFLIAAWYMQLKMAGELCKKKTHRLVPIVYFLLATLAFLAYGLVIKKIPEFTIADQESLRRYILLGFVVLELLVQGYISFELFFNSFKQKDHLQKRFFTQAALIVAVIALLKTASLYFSPIHWVVGIYFILIFFAGNLPLYFYLLSQIQKLPQPEQQSPVEINETLFAKYKITQREQEIIIEICKGKTNQEIADKLFISLQTVKDHTHNIFQKAGIKNRVQLSQLFGKNSRL